MNTRTSSPFNTSVITVGLQSEGANLTLDLFGLPLVGPGVDTEALQEELVGFIVDGLVDCTISEAHLQVRSNSMQLEIVGLYRRTEESYWAIRYGALALARAWVTRNPQYFVQ